MYSRMDQVQFVEDSFKKFEMIWSANAEIDLNKELDEGNETVKEMYELCMKKVYQEYVELKTEITGRIK